MANFLTRVVSAKYATIMIMMSVLSGCFGFLSQDNNEDITPHYYVIDVDRGAVASTFPKNRRLLIRPVRVTSYFKGQPLVFKIGDNEYYSQPKHQFFSTPELMFTEQLKRWLQKSGQFSYVTIDDSEQTEMVLESAVTALYGDQRQQYSPQAVLEMQFFLMEYADASAKPLFQTGLKVEVSIDEATPENTVKGWDQALEELLATLEDDLSGYFSLRNP